MGKEAEVLPAEMNPPSAGAEHSQAAQAAHHDRGRAKVGVDGVADGRGHGSAPGFDDGPHRAELPLNLGPLRITVNTGPLVRCVNMRWVVSAGDGYGPVGCESP